MDFPKTLEIIEKLLRDVIEEMNNTMVKIGAIKEGKRAFVVSKKKLKYHFDLRCPSITWVDDINLSLDTPLGISLVNTNIKNGEILWGEIVIWGGLIDQAINRQSRSTITERLLKAAQMTIQGDTIGGLNTAFMASGTRSLESLLTPKNTQIDIGGYKFLYFKVKGTL